MISVLLLTPLVAWLARLSTGRWGVSVAVGVVVAWGLTAAVIRRWVRRAP